MPSLLAEVLGREIRQQLLGLPALRHQLSLLPPVRLPVPGPEPVCDVPADFLPSVGYHSPHPGTGKGEGAQRRSPNRTYALPLPI